MGREEREILVAKLNDKIKTSFDKGSRVLPELTIGDKVRIQNHTTLRKIRWDILRDCQYKVLIDGSCCVKVRNRRHLCKIETPTLEVKLEDDDEEE